VVIGMEALGLGAGRTIVYSHMLQCQNPSFNCPLLL
jgi:hypothetical protein